MNFKQFLVESIINKCPNCGQEYGEGYDVPSKDELGNPECKICYTKLKAFNTSPQQWVPGRGKLTTGAKRFDSPA